MGTVVSYAELRFSADDADDATGVELEPNANLG